MGIPVIQRILKCAECGKIPENGDPMWGMPNGHWCESCCNDDDDDDDYDDDYESDPCPVCFSRDCNGECMGDGLMGG